MKAILVVEMPNGYGDIADNKAVVTLRNGKLGTSLGIYNVPLKPLPKALSVNEDEDDVSQAIGIGWNACLEEITGETE